MEIIEKFKNRIIEKESFQNVKRNIAHSQIDYQKNSLII